jgi:glycosyltransferase involved in cell wall biosynthesis
MTRETVAAERGETSTAKPNHEIPRLRLLVVGSHVVQYSSPIFRKMASDGRIDLLVAYCSMQGAEPGVDPGFGVKVSWDTPVLEGYSWVHVPNRAPRPGLGRFFGLLNPGLWSLIRDGKFDAVFVSGYFYASAWIAILAAKLRRVPILFTTEAHSLRSWATQSKWKLRLKKFYMRRILSLGNVLLTMSTGSLQQLVALGFPSNRIVLSPYCVDNDWWTRRAQEADREVMRAEWRIPPGSAVTLFCAKLQPWKGPLDLLEAFARAGVADSHLVFAGDGPLRDQLEQRAAELGLSNRVRFLGFVNQSQLPAVYRAADLLVLSSHYEPFGLVVNEAMLCGCPVVVSDRVGAKFDLVRPGENGYVYPAGDVERLAAVLREILTNPENRARMGAAARQRMESWSPREYVESMVRAVQLAAKKQ